MNTAYILGGVALWAALLAGVLLFLKGAQQCRGDDADTPSC